MFDVNNDVRIAPKLQARPLDSQPQKPTEEFPFWDNESLLAYARRTCHTSVEEFGELLLAACERLDKKKAHANDSHR